MGKIDPKQMQRMMKQLGIQSEEIEAKKVIIETGTKKIIILNPSITAINMKGQKSFQISGEVKEEAGGVPDEDIEMVAEQTGKTKKEAEKALTETNGDIAEAILKLKK
ncbi:MAG: nascent polypeptide-associated complex protein [archaeon]|nr:nascent polypeptide-associated complex protein [archaeon]